MATLKDEISMAISSHSVWKSRLRKAIDTREIDLTPENISKDNLCVFGKWLDSDAISQDIRNSEQHKRVKQLHAKFHIVAAEVVQLALQGNKADAEKYLEANGEYTVISAKLVMEMSSWMKVL